MNNKACSVPRVAIILLRKKLKFWEMLSLLKAKGGAFFTKSCVPKSKFKKGQTINTENSEKTTVNKLDNMLSNA